MFLYLKQGYYNYEYVLLRDDKSPADDTFIEGMLMNRERLFNIIYIMHGNQVDQLIGVKKINSNGQ